MSCVRGSSEAANTTTTLKTTSSKAPEPKTDSERDGMDYQEEGDPSAGILVTAGPSTASNGREPNKTQEDGDSHTVLTLRQRKEQAKQKKNQTKGSGQDPEGRCRRETHARAGRGGQGYQGYVLNFSYRYVLTRGLNSDPIESLFSCLRQFEGGNDRVDARTAVFTLEKLLKVGILQAARDGNAPLSFEMEAPVRLSVSDANTCTLAAAVESATTELSSELAYLTLWSQAEADLELAPVAFLAGYIVRACVKKVPCEPCIALLQTPEATGPLHGVIKKMDNGGLTYPRMEVVRLCKLTCTFVQVYTVHRKRPASESSWYACSLDKGTA
ncbi:hypothetical protein HPB49_006786 [Dermacentor silvarum]|uniref:Uncharacterized protein n=1 Tax=Dermacentor silvarum TaxID=543639 RepID=A0ACB8DB95_DERSI|nr:hypothetical protein HPB49_006786 [Dermacentor silvarum]